jgi:phosphatidylserine decarboxylase
MKLASDLNFVVTNWIPRRSFSRFMGWFSRIEQPLVRDVSIGAFRLFAGDLRLHEAKKPTFASLHDCFVRELRDGAREIAPDARLLVSPCDGIVVSAGRVDDARLLQVKGSTYTLAELFADPSAVERYYDGCFVTLRLTSSMYHRFHAPCDCRVVATTHINGDRWNVNPPTLNRVERLYCRNERAVVHLRVDGNCEPMTIVAVGAVLVGSIRLHFVDLDRHTAECRAERIECAASFRKGDEIGYFEHGSTIIVVATKAVEVLVQQGALVRMGQPMLARRRQD